MTGFNHTRVTTVLQPFSGLNKIDPGILKNAANRGTVVHQVCESIVKGFDKIILDSLVEEYTTDEMHFVSEKKKVENLVESFEKWYEKKDFKLYSKRFFCDDLMITGECDYVYEDYRGLVLVDLKTTVSESKTWLLQGSAYSYMSKKAGYPIRAIEFVKLSKSGEEPEIFRYAENFNLFKAAYDTYNHFYKDFKEENILDYL
jgi:Holliday junction resolvase-like predicted endonuclease